MDLKGMHSINASQIPAGERTHWQGTVGAGAEVAGVACRGSAVGQH